MVEIKTRDDVLDNARAVFETAPWLVDLTLALCDRNRVCTVNLKEQSTGGSVEWPPESDHG